MTPESVRTGKKATALVEISTATHGKGYASAFCIDASGVFVTNAHVTDSAVNGRLTLVLNPGEKDQQVLQATLLHSDKTMDLAVMKATGAGPVPVLEVGADDQLTETMPLTAFGFPFGEALAMDQATYPSISVNAGRITSLRKKNGELEVIQVDAALNPGNSGGPVLDDQGRVIGIVQAGVPGSGVNFVISVSRLQKFLDKPEITLAPASIPYDQKNIEHDFSVGLVCLKRPRPQYSVTLTFTTAKETRTFLAKSAPGSDTFTVRAIPIPAGTEPKMLQITAVYSNGSITARMRDQSLSVAGKAMQLSSVRHISHSAASTTQPAQLTLANGQSASGLVTGLEAAKADVGEVSITLDLTKASDLTIDDLDRSADEVRYTVTLRLVGKDETLAQAQGHLELTAGPQGPGMSNPAAVAGAIQPPLPINPGMSRLPHHTTRLIPGAAAPNTVAEAIPQAGSPLNLAKQLVLEAKDDHLRRVFWSPNGQILAGITDQGLQLWDMTGDEPYKAQKFTLEHFNNGANMPVAFSPDGKYLAAAGADFMVRLYLMSNGSLRLQSTGEGHDRQIFAVAFSHDGKTVLSGADDMAALIWDVKDGKLQQRDIIKINGGFGIKYVTFFPDDAHFAATCATGDVSVVDLVDGKPRLASSFKIAPGFFDLPTAISPATGQLLFGSQKTAYLWTKDAASAWVAHDKNITAVAWSCDGQYFATASDDGRLIVWDATGKTCYTLQRPSRFIDVKFAPANKASPSAGLCVAALNENGNIYLLHLDAPAASTQH